MDARRWRPLEKMQCSFSFQKNSQVLAVFPHQSLHAHDFHFLKLLENFIVHAVPMTPHALNISSRI
jgi:hypothetical protein